MCSIERLRNARGHREILRCGSRRAGGDLQATLDLAHVVGEGIQARTVRHTDLVAHALDLVVDRIEDALVALAAQHALLGGAAAAEHALEYDLRVQFHRQRRGRRGPGDRVGIDAAVTFAAVARTRTRVFHRDFHRRQQRFLPVPGGDDLVDGLASVDVGTRGLARLLRTQERGSDPVVGTGFTRRRLGRARVQPGQDIQVLAERLHRLPDERQFVRQCADFLGNPVARCRAVRHEAAEETRRRLCRGPGLCREGGDHRIQQGKGKRGAGTAQQGATADVLPGNEHGFSPPANCGCLRVHGEGRTLDHTHDQRREPVVVLRRVVRQRTDQRHVVVIEATADGIGQQVLDHHFREQLALAHRQVAQALDAVDAGAVVDDGDRVDRVADLRRAPLADGVEVLHRQSHRLELLLTAGAARVGAVHQQTLAHGLGCFTGFLVQLGFHARRRIRRTHAEERLQEPLAAFHRRRALRIGRDGQPAHPCPEGPCACPDRPPA